MDLTFSTEERAFEKEVRDYIAQSLSPETRRAQALTPSVFSDPDIGIAWQKSLHKKGCGAP
jgi:acyl-CoA dehydrogenase